MNLHKQLHDKHYNHLLPHFPSLTLISLKTEMSAEDLLEMGFKVEIYFHKLLGFDFVEKDEDFVSFWKSSVSVSFCSPCLSWKINPQIDESKKPSFKGTTKNLFNDFKFFNMDLVSKLGPFSFVKSCPG